MRFLRWLLRRRFDEEGEGVEWWTVSLTFPARNEAEADAVWERIHAASCEGLGHGRLHWCYRPCVSSLKPEPVEDEPEVQRIDLGRASWTLSGGNTWSHSGTNAA